MKKDFYKELEEKGFLIAAHRGSFGGSVIDNTELSSKVALAMGADIVEMDVIKSTDEVLYAFHDGEEPRRFGIEENIKTLSSKEIDELDYKNVLGEKTGQRVNRLEDLLLSLKGKCFINLDRSWDYLKEVFELVKKLEMEDQIIIKTHPTDEAFDFLTKNENKLMYMVIASKKEDVLKFMVPEINMVAAELLFESEDSEVIENEFLNYLKNKNIKIWINSITLGSRFNLSAHYDDNLSILNDGEGWRWLIDKGVDIIQTDWPALVKNYRNVL
ncbi:glycerophosphodiester phosphodiesterase family protein [Fusobacterium sp.]|uniref:glycerophosphodiester phosphodiesterase family protein n=1 Tax=Fusobacterium sp. TaxID=68766 RepID=UPI00260EAEC7|nr:glycerophosphodiester phosphodiesterase family protein [Fusobacterium sp.]